MDFFEHQARARKNTIRLLALFSLAVLATIGALYVVGLAIDLMWQRWTERYDFRLWKPEVFLWVCLGALVVIGWGTIHKLLALAKGGRTVAIRLKGRLVEPSSVDPAERRLLSIVEEMSLAAGLPVPQVYLLPNERCINALIAGWAPSDAVLAVTHGALRVLSRDELQGLVAHELAHLLHGDARLNMRLMAVLHGLLSIGMLGSALIVLPGTRGDERPVGDPRLAFVGVLIATIGSIGLFFGRLIKAAVSRQREFHADAAAVALTRNPLGIAGALKKIGGARNGAILRAFHAEEASHMYVATGLKLYYFEKIYDTHPPLEERVRALDPAFRGDFPAVKLPPPPTPAPLPSVKQRLPFDPVAVAGQVGAPTIAHLGRGSALLEALPELLRVAVRRPLGAKAATYALLLVHGGEEGGRGRLAMESRAGREECAETLRLLPHAQALHPALRLPLLDLAAPALRLLSREEAANFLDTLSRIVAADQQTDLFEFTLSHLARRRLRTESRGVVRYHSLQGVRDQLALLLAMLAHHGHATPDEGRRALETALGPLFELGALRPANLRVPPPEARTFDAFAGALDRIAFATPAVKRLAVEACARCVQSDGSTTVPEAELLRAVADSLDCPLPPFLPDVAAGESPAPART
ncbi:MAG: M48 family metalloprotease [Planctomycetaceae bacterium]